MRAMFFALILTTACASTETATAQRDQDGAPTAACVLTAGEDDAARRACIGQSAQYCIDNSDGGETTVGTIQCAMAERAQWEAIRAGQIATLRASESPSQIELLDAAIAAHERWSRAHCAYEASIFEGGSLERVAAAMCMNETMAQHTLGLIARSEIF